MRAALVDTLASGRRLGEPYYSPNTPDPRV